MHEGLEALIAGQAGMVARRQLNAHGLDWDRARNQITAGRWVERTPRVISTTTGPLSLDQWLWLAVLHAGPRSMLGSLSAASQYGLRGWEREHVSVIVDDELSFEPVDGIDFFRSRRPYSLLRAPRPGIPVCRLEPALLLFAGYEATNRAAHAVVAAAVQQRLTTASRMLEWIDLLRPLRRAKPLRATLADVAGGAHSGAELDVRRLCRRFGFPAPVRQRPRTDRAGRRRWTDCEWELEDGTTLVLEVDGSFHMDVRQWHDDLRRARRITDRRRIVVRCSAYELRHEQERVGADLIALGLPGRVPDNAG